MENEVDDTKQAIHHLLQSIEEARLGETPWRWGVVQVDALDLVSAANLLAEAVAQRAVDLREQARQRLIDGGTIQDKEVMRQ